MSSVQDVFASTGPLPQSAADRWPLYLLLAFVLALLLGMSARWMPPVWGDSLALAWMLIGGCAGVFMLFAWFFTDHDVASWNANLLLLHPSMLLAMLPVLRKAVVLLTAAGMLLAFGVQWLPAHQYTADVLAVVVPLSGLACLRLWKMQPAATQASVV